MKLSRLTILVLILALLIQRQYYTGHLNLRDAHRLIDSVDYLINDPEEKCVEVGNNLCIYLND